MHIKIIWVGKARKNDFTELLADYERRIGRFCSISLTEIKDSNSPEPELQRKTEGEKILSALKPEDYLVLLDEKGKNFTSEGFAAKIQSIQGKNIKSCVFVMGGAYGFSKTVYERADEQIALSQMTFTHQMVRLIFIEQLYRAFSIINKMPYHH
ncbi:MAG: 23S rRNA (pseudouridine(1915)-N(3))-methyltransferase RlmH [Bacteroidetes bacterium]|nr:23S rRNA (pseudouridine(1915)-N(3))-methyltransferase RlmH [Bacteroidota bacterium]